MTRAKTLVTICQIEWSRSLEYAVDNNDTVVLGANANTVNTAGGNDVITSGGGANTITPGAGNDTVNAGAGVDTIRLANAGAIDADTINSFGATDVISINIGAAAVTGASAKVASAIAAFGVVPTGATSPVLQNVGGTATTNAVVFQAIAPNATATLGTVAATSNVIALNGAYTDGTAAGVFAALGTSAAEGIATTAAGRFLLVTYSVGNIAQVWSYGGDSVLDSNITAVELSLVATLNGVALNGLTAANFSTYLTPVAATTTVSNVGQTINLTGTVNTVLSTANTAGQFLTAGADTINVGVGTLPTAVTGVATGSMTIIDPGTGDADVLNATALSDWAVGSVISGIETINLNMLVAGTTFSAAAKTPGTTTFGLTGTQNFTVTALPNAGAITLGLDYAGTASAALISESGTADSLTVNLSGNTKASNLVYVGTGLEKADVNVTAASSILMNGTDLFGAAGNVDATKLAGSGSLTVFGSGTNLGSLNLNGSDVGYTGSLTLRPSASAAMDFSTNTADAGLVTGIKTIDLQDTTGWTGAITLAGANSTTNAPVTVSFSPTTLSGNTTIGAVTISQVGGGLSDAVTFSMGANATAVGALTMNSIETVTINSSRIAANTFTVGNIALDDAVGTQKISITSASTVALGSATFTADTVDMVGVTGATTGTLTLANTGGVLFTGPTGAISVVGSAVADNITTGAGNDTVSGKAGADVINVGSGTDTVIFAASSTAAAAGTNTSADTITGITFGTGADVLTISITAQATAFLLTNGNNGAVTAGVTPVVQHALTATATAFGSTTNVLVLDAIYANAAAVKTAIEAGGSTALTQNTTFTAASDFLLIWSDGTNGHVTFVNDTSTTGGAAALAAGDATLTEVATLIGVTTVAGAVAANFVFID